MDKSRKQPSGGADGHRAGTGNERRRIGRIVHDERGNASVDWLDAPSNYRRTVLELEGESKGPLAIQKAPQTFDPYERTTLPEPKKAVAPRKDLKKLSEWIKLMRDLDGRRSKDEE
jgi:hypothetical protein